PRRHRRGPRDVVAGTRAPGGSARLGTRQQGRPGGQGISVVRATRVCEHLRHGIDASLVGWQFVPKRKHQGGELVVTPKTLPKGPVSGLAPSFQYTPAASTDLARSFARIRRQLLSEQQTAAPTLWNVRDLLARKGR